MNIIMKLIKRSVWFHIGFIRIITPILLEDMKRTQAFNDKALPQKRHNATPVQSGSSWSSSPAPHEVTRSSSPHKNFDDNAYVSTPNARPSFRDTSVEDNGTAVSETSDVPGNQMFAHASHLNFWDSVFATGPVNLTYAYAAERNTEEILKVSL